MKYILEIKPEYEANGIMILGARDSHLYVTTLEVKDLEELNSDYINEHFGWLQDDAYERGHGIGYQKGFEDGKAVNDKGCAWCAHEGESKIEVPCILCSNNFKNQWQAKTDNCIEIGDEVEHSVKCFVVTVMNDEYVFGISKDGTWCYASIKNVRKTGRHFDIASILKEMQS